MTWHPAPVTPSGARGLRPIPIALPWKDLGIKKGSHLDTVFVSQKKQIPVPNASMSPMIWFQISVLGHRWLQHKNRKLLSTMPCCNKGSHCRSCRSAGFRFWTTNLSQSTHVENQLSCIRDDGLLFHLLQSSWAEAWQGIWLVGGEIPTMNTSSRSHGSSEKSPIFFHATMTKVILSDHAPQVILSPMRGRSWKIATAICQSPASWQAVSTAL